MDGYEPKYLLDNYRVQCAWCLRFKNVHTGEWEDGPAYKLPGHSHGVCPDCKKKTLDKELKELKKSREGYIL